MALLDTRQRSGFLFVAVIVGHIILISAQVNARTGVPILEAVTFGVFAEVQRAMWVGTSGIRQVWSGYLGLRHLKTQNDDLRRQLADAEVDLQSQRALADRSRGLERLLALRDQSDRLGLFAVGVLVAPERVGRLAPRPGIERLPQLRGARNVGNVRSVGHAEIDTLT